MNKALPYLIQGNNIVVLADNKAVTITSSSIGYTALKKAIIDGNWDLVPELITPVKAITQYAKKGFEVIDGVIYEDGVQVNSGLTERIFKMFEEGFPIDNMIKFYHNLKQNPSKVARDEVFGFMDVCSLPITEDGYIIAYKKVRSDYLDCHSGTMDNSVGKVVQMDRDLVDPNRNRTCSVGLHFCSVEYLKSFHGERTVIVKINPADIVAIPSDYNNSKGRTWKYEVIGEVTNEEALSDVLSESSVYSMSDAEIKADYVETHDETEDDNSLCVSHSIVRKFSNRELALIFNHLTGSSIKKFSYRADAERRLLNVYPDSEMYAAAEKLDLV